MPLLAEAESASLLALSEWERANPAATFYADSPGLGRWGMADWQRAVAEDGARRISVLGANKIGKSTILAWLAWSFLLGFHPRWKRPVGRDAVVLYVAANLEDAYPDDVSRSLYDFHTPAAVASDCTYTPERGYYAAGRRMLSLRGGRVVFRSGYQDPQACAGVWADLVLVNEIPSKTHWGEIMRSSWQAQAPVVAGFTAVPPELLRRNDDLGWFWQKIDDTEHPWSQHVVPLRPHTVPHRTRESIDEQISDTFAWERPQRIDAARHGPVPDRYYSAWTDDRILPEDFELPDGDYWTGVGIDHGEGAKRQVAVLAFVHVETGDAYLWDCCESTGKTDSARDAVAICDMLARAGLNPEAPDEWRGDTNTGGKSEAGLMANQLLEQEIASHIGLPRTRPPCRILPAKKGPGSVAAGCGLLHRAMVRDRLWVHPRCAPVVAHFRGWRGPRDNRPANQALTHAGDAVRYILRDQLDQRDHRVVRLPRR